jgi:hypothetical protein
MSTPTSHPQPVSARGIVLVLGGIAIAMAVAGAFLFVGYSERAKGDPQRLAVAPFDVMVEQPELSTARTQLARDLTRAFEESGTHSAVPQSEVARVWRARQTPFIAAIELARQTGAGLAIYGRVDSAGGDSVWVRAAVLDAHSTRGLFEVQTRATPETLGPAADSLAAQVLSKLRGG